MTTATITIQPTVKRLVEEARIVRVHTKEVGIFGAISTVFDRHGIENKELFGQVVDSLLERIGRPKYSSPIIPPARPVTSPQRTTLTQAVRGLTGKEWYLQEDNGMA